MSGYLTVEEVAAELRVTEKTIYRLLRQGEITATKIGREWRLHRRSVDEWIRRSSVGVRLNILVIDDEARIQYLFKETLEELGHRVVGAESGSEGIELIRDRDFDRVFLDLKLPDTDGAELLQHMKTIKPGLPVTVITGYPDSDSMSRVLRHGPLHVIHKPFGPEEILAAINGSHYLK